MMAILALSLMLFLIFQDLLLCIFLYVNFKDYSHNYQRNWPKVSVFLPCRNEELNLKDCLEALGKIQYPKEKLQLILGNDRSTDDTAQILQSWVKENPESTYFEVMEGDIHRMNGKANALSQMAKISKGDFYLYTDADCVVPPTWLTEMVSACLLAQAGMVTGITKVSGQSKFEVMQSLDWWLTLGMVKIMDDLGNSVTSMGNNMLISKEAYEAVGGFEGIPFSLTEDFEMAKNVLEKGFRNIHFVSKGNLVETKAQQKFKELLKQRKRWMAGAMGLPVFWKVLLSLQVLFFPAILFYCFLYPLEGFLIWSMKVIIQGVFLYSFASKTGQKLKIRDLIGFEIYYLIISWSTIVYYFWPSKTDWKGRGY